MNRNPALLCAFRALQMSLFPIAVVTIFWQYEIGLSMTEIFVLQAILAGTMSLLEFPSGYLADRIGYRTTLVAAALTMMLGWSIYLFSPTFWTMALAEAVLGIGLSLVSGTDGAILYESLLEIDREQDFARWHGRMRFYGQTAEGTAALLAGILYAASPKLPFAMQVLAWAMAAGVALRMVEPMRHPGVVTDAVAHMRRIAREVLRGTPRLRAVMFLTVAFTLTTFVPVWIIQLYAERSGVPIAWLGPIWATANYSVAVASLASARLGQALGLIPSLLVCIALAGVGYGGLGLTTAWWGFAFYYLLTLTRGLNGPILHHEEQRLIPSADRASYVSFRNLLFRLVFVVVGPLVGLGIDRHGEHAVLLITGAGVTIACGLGLLWLRHARAADEVRHGSESRARAG